MPQGLRPDSGFISPVTQRGDFGGGFIDVASQPAPVTIDGALKQNTFNLELPDGTVLEGIPDGTTKEQIRMKLQAGGYDMSLLGESPAPEQVQLPQVTEQDPQPQQDDFFTRMTQDLQSRGGQIGESFDRFGYSNIGDVEQQGMGSTLLQTAGIGAGAIGDLIGNIGISAFRALPDVVEQPIREGASALGGYVMDSPVGESLGEISQAYSEVVEDDPVLRANLGALGNIAGFVPVGKPLASATKGIGESAKAVAQKALPTIDDALRPLAKRARDLGIPLRMDQIKPSKTSRTVQKVSQAIPFSGTDAFEDAQRSAWNKSLAKSMGIDAGDFSPESVQVFRANNSKMFDDVLSGKNISIDNMDVARLASVKDMDIFGLIPNDRKILLRDIAKTVEDFATGDMSGQKIASARSYLMDKSLKAGNASPAYVEMVNALDDIVEKSLSPEDVLKLKEARKQYKYFKTAQPLIEESTDGQINPTKLLQRVKSSKYIDSSVIPTGQEEFIDLARIGKTFLPKQGGSDTFEKSLFATGAIGGGGQLATGDPLSALGIIGGTAVGNRALQSGVLRNQALINQMLKNRSQVFRKPTVQSLGDYGILGATSALQGLTREEQ